MTVGYDEACKALDRGEVLRLQRWKKKLLDQNGRAIEVFETVVLFPARILTSGEKPPRASREVTDHEADELAKLPNVLDERDGPVDDGG